MRDVYLVGMGVYSRKEVQRLIRHPDKLCFRGTCVDVGMLVKDCFQSNFSQPLTPPTMMSTMAASFGIGCLPIGEGRYTFPMWKRFTLTGVRMSFEGTARRAKPTTWSRGR